MFCSSAVRRERRELHELGVEDRLLVKHRFDQPGLDGRSFIMQPRDHPNQLFLAEGHHDAAAYGRIQGGQTVLPTL
jgi:hypothetical protein